MKPHDENNPGELRPLVVDRVTAAKLLSIILRMLDELVRRHAIPSWKEGKRRLFAVAALQEWAMKRGSEWRA